MRSGEVRQGLVRLLADDLSAEGFGPLRWVLRNPDAVWSGKVRLGKAWWAKFWHGAAWVADGSTEAQVSLLLSQEQLWQDLVRHGRAWTGWLRFGMVWSLRVWLIPCPLKLFVLQLG